MVGEADCQNIRKVSVTCMSLQIPIGKHGDSSATSVSMTNSVVILTWCGLLPDAQNLPTDLFFILSMRYVDQVEEAYTLLQLQYSDDPQGGTVLIYSYINGYYTIDSEQCGTEADGTDGW